jgi:ribosome maturation factor RimP
MINKALEIEQLLAPVAEKENMEVIDAEYVRENGDLIARIFIDKDGGINMDDCAKMSGIFSAILDESAILSDSYVLEVSSPGMDRALKNEKAFKKFTGNKIRVKTAEPINNQKNFLGELLACDNGNIKINDVTNGEVEIGIANIVKANLEPVL